MRCRIIYIILAFGIGAGSSWQFNGEIFTWLLIPGGGRLSPPAFGGLPVFTAPQDMFTLTIFLAILGGLVTSIPVALVSFYTLARPILPPNVRKFIVTSMILLGVLFLGGAAFAYYVMVPRGLDFLLEFNKGVAVPFVAVGTYMRLILTMMFWLGIIFELPLVIFLLVKLHVVSYEKVRSWRRVVFLGSFLMSAIITPSADIINSIMVAVPIILLFEFGLLLAWIASRGDRRHA